MTKPVITTRAGKGSALTWTEGDNNLTNLRDATVTIKADAAGTDVVSDLNGTVTLVAGTNVTITGDNTAKTVTINAAGGSGITDLVQDTTPQLGGDLDVNGKNITSASNGNIVISPNGSGNISLTPATGKITLGALDFPTGMGTNGQVLTTNGSSTMSWTTISSGGIGNVVEDTTPQLGGALDVNGFAISSVSNGHIDLTPNGTGNIRLTPASGKIVLGASDWPTGMGTNGQVLTTNGAGTLSWSTSSGGITDLVQDTTPQLGGSLDVNGQSIVSASNGNISISPNGSGNIQLTPATGKITLGAVDWPTASPANNSFLVGQAAGTSAWSNTLKGYNEGTLYDLGTTGGTIAPNAANGNVQKITLNSALTINAFTSPVAGQSITLIIYGGTSYTSITSTMKFAGGTKTLTATAGCIDILSIYYDGTNYFASLGKGFA